MVDVEFDKEAKGLGTCPIRLITAYDADIADVPGITEDREIVLGPECRWTEMIL